MAKYRCASAVEKIRNQFTYHPPKDDQAERYGIIRDAGKRFALAIANATPPGLERDAAIAAVREAVMWANAAIACNE